MYFILDITGKPIGTSDQAVNLDDLSTRNEIAVFSNLELQLHQVEVIGFPDNPVIQPISALPTLPKLFLVTSAEDTDGDGFPELPANGQTQATVDVFLRDHNGQPIADPIDVHFRTSAGAISHRKVVAKGGKASIKLRAGQDTVMAHVKASAEGFESAELTFEFIPPSELKPPTSTPPLNPG